MANDGNSIYIDTNSTPNRGVEIVDLQQVLGRGENDLGLLCSDKEWNAAGTALVSANKVNKNAKYKSVRSSKLTAMTDADFQDAYFGLNIPIYGSGYITSLSTFFDSFASAYSYLPPRGKGNGQSGADEWFRILDFNGYNKNARSFVNESGCSFPHQYEYGGAGSLGCNFTLSLNNTVANLRGGVSISDLKLGGSEGTTFSSLYFGLIFKHGTDTPKIITATSTVLSSGGLTLTITDSGGDGLDGLSTSYTYTVYPILCSNAHSSLGNVGNLDNIVPLPVATFQFSQYPASARVTYYIDSADAYQGPSAKLVITATVGILSTGGYESISTNHIQLYRASSDSDMSGSLITSDTLSVITTTTPVTWEPTPIHIDQFPSYVRIHLYNDSVSGMTLDYWVLVREDAF